MSDNVIAKVGYKLKRALDADVPKGLSLTDQIKYRLELSQKINPIFLSKRVSLNGLDGCGSLLAKSFVNFIRGNPSYNKVYDKCFEWCSGPAFIGFELLAQGICNKLCLADINPLAIESVKHTVEENGLQDKVTYYVSDNFKSIPKEEKFDLVVSNPPNYFNVNEEHPEGKKLLNDLRPNDRGWVIHQGFYSGVKDYLKDGALLLISEVEPYEKLVYIPKSEAIPYDIRNAPAIEDFARMISEGGLSLIETKRYCSLMGTGFWMMVSTYAEPPAKIEEPPAPPAPTLKDRFKKLFHV